MLPTAFLSPHDCHISYLLFVLLQELGLSLGVLGWFMWSALAFVGGFRACWVLRVADLGPLPLLVGRNDPWISGLLCVGWLWPLVEGRDS